MTGTMQARTAKPKPLWRRIGIVVLWLVAAYMFVFRPGFYNSTLSGTWSSHAIVEPSAHVYLYFRGETDRQWKWSRSQSARYEKVRIEWLVGSSAKDALEVMPSQGLFEVDGKTYDLTADLISNTFAGSNLDLKGNEVFREEVKSLVTFLVSAGDGSAPPPRHHTYSMSEESDKLIRHVNFRHFSTCHSLESYLHTGFIVALLVVFCTGHLRKKPTASPVPLSLRRPFWAVFLVILLGAVAAADYFLVVLMLIMLLIYSLVFLMCWLNARQVAYETGDDKP